MSDAITERVIRTDIDMQVAARDGQIHLLFNERNQSGEPVPAYTANFLMSASDALVCSSMMADLAFETENGLRIPGAQKQELVERHRSTMFHRYIVYLNANRENKTITNEMMAQKLTDLFSAEVFQ